MTNPYLIDGPAVISFSGGRTSAYMLFHVLQAHGGKLPEDVKVCFANTGKEMPQTLDFVHACGERWGVPIVWLEYNPQKEHKVEIVNYQTASRNGEPFDRVIEARQFLPNPVTRFCTAEMKIRTMYRYAYRILGWKHWINAVGLRADEPRRVAKIRNQRERWETIAPLAEAGVTVADIGTFWQAQPFDLELPNINGKTHLGNCDLCFLKGAQTIQNIMKAMPERADWWIEKENQSLSKKPTGARFRIDRPCYADLLRQTQSQSELEFGNIDELQECYCHD